MKVAVLLLLSFLTGAAQAIRPVSPTINQQDYQAIHQELQRGRQHEATIALIKGQIKDALLDKDDSILRPLYASLREEERKRNVSMTLVLKMTMTAYDIPAPSGVSAHELNKGARITYVPVFDPELLQTYSAYTQGGAIPVPPPDPNIIDPRDPNYEHARTIFNGVSIFRTMPSDPRDIALLLIHESTHAEQFIGAKPRDYAEYRARKAAYDSFLAVGYDKAADEKRRKAYEKYARDAKSDADYAATFLGKSVLFFNGISPAAEDAKRHGFGLSQDKLNYLQTEALKLRSSVEIEESIRAEEQRRRMYAEAPPAPLAAPYIPHIPPPQPLSPDLVARAADSNADRVRRMVDAACVNDWSGTDILSYDRLSAVELDRLRDVASRTAPGCSRSLLERLIAMRWSGAPLDLARLQLEVQTILNPSPVYEAPVERDRRPGGCIKRGVWHKDCY